MMDILIQKYAVCRSDMIQTFRITAYVDPKIEADDYKTAPNFTTNNEIINQFSDIDDLQEKEELIVKASENIPSVKIYFIYNIIFSI